MTLDFHAWIEDNSRLPAEGGDSHCRARLSQIQRTRGSFRGSKAVRPEPVRLAVIAAVRHQFTNYDRLLQEGVERQEARALVSRDLEKKLEQWRRGNDG